MKRNTFLRKIDNQDTIIDIDGPSPNDSKYLYYPNQKTEVKVPAVIDKNIDKVIETNIINNKEHTKDINDLIWKNVSNNIIHPKIPTAEAKEVKEDKKAEDKKEDVKEEVKEDVKEDIKVESGEEVKVEEEKLIFTEEELLFNLKIISELNPSDKLSYDEKLFSIDNPSYVQGIYRWWYKEDRGKTLEKLNKIIDATFNFMDKTFMNQIKYPNMDSNEERVLYETNSQIIQKFYINLIDAIKGLDKLKLTYTNDKSMTTGLNLLIERIRRRTDKINEILKINA